MKAGLNLEPWLILDVLGVEVLVEASGSVISVSFPTTSLPADKVPTVGDALDVLIDLIEPGRVLDLEPPWDAIASSKLPHFTLKVDLNTASRSFGFEITQLGLAVGPASLSSISFTIKTATGAKKGSRKKQFIFDASAKIGDLDLGGLSWNLLRETPPAPAPKVKAPIFKLDYLAFGQHVSLVSAPKTLDGVISALSGTPPKDDINPLPSTALAFNAESSWLAAARFSLVGVTLGIIFNDPDLYGAKISIDASRVKALKPLDGLAFEVLYRRIADGLGLFHIELKLPDKFRRFEVGAATLTLPIIDLDIYTNGSFLIDFGFPHNHDYSRSATLELIILGIPVLGAGGFYFGVLDQRTGPNLPALVPGTGRFSPVIVFGLGLKIGLGKSIDKGILKAGFELSVEGIIEGVLAFYESTDKSVTDTYYKISGMIALVGHLYGSIDFVVIKARVDLMVFAGVQFVYEAYKGAVITLSAEVSIEVSLDVDLGIFSFSVSFSFEAHVQADFTIEVADNHKWIAA